MKKALIQGTRICEVRDDIFPVAPDLRWVDVADDTTTRDMFNNGIVVKEIVPAPFVEPKRLTVEALAQTLKAKGILNDSDIEQAKEAKTK